MCGEGPGDAARLSYGFSRPGSLRRINNSTSTLCLLLAVCYDRVPHTEI